MTNYDAYEKETILSVIVSERMVVKCRRSRVDASVRVEGRGGCQTQVGCFRDQTWHFKRVDFLQIQADEHQASQTESLDSPTVYTENRRCQVKSLIISKNFIIGPYPHLSENSVIGPFPTQP
jgi:hypothetical protein